MSRTQLVSWGVGLALILSASPSPASSPQARPMKETVRGADDGAKNPVRPRGPGGVGGMGVNTPVLMLTSEVARKELKIRPDQKLKIIDVNDRFNRKREAAFKDLTKEGGRVDREALMAMIADLRAENESALAEVLDPGQRRRLAQIILQFEGPLALVKPEVAAAINLDPDQVATIRGMVEQYKEAQEQLWEAHDDSLKSLRDQRMGPPPGSPGAGAKAKATSADGRRAAVEVTPKPGIPRVDPQIAAMNDRFQRESNTLLDSTVRQVSRVLSRRQKEAFNKLLGEPFDSNPLGQGVDRGGQDSPPTILEPVTPAVPSDTKAKVRDSRQP
jgi:hypothetical protein